MTKLATTTPTIEVDPAEATLKKLRSLKGQLYDVAKKLSKEPRFTRAETKVLEAMTDVQQALDELRGQDQPPATKA